MKNLPAKMTGSLQSSDKSPHCSLADVIRLKMMVDKRKPTMKDLSSWAGNVRDLHRVFSIVKSLFLTLETNNEALLRVGVELVTCKQSRKVLTWHEDWYGDEVRRLWFQKQVQQKLEKVVEVVGDTRFQPDSEDAEDPLELKEKLLASEATLAEALEKVQRLKVQLADSGFFEDSQDQIDKLNDAVRKHQAELRELRELHRQAEEQVKILTAPDANAESAEEQARKLQEVQKIGDSEQEALVCPSCRAKRAGPTTDCPIGAACPNSQLEAQLSALGISKDDLAAGLLSPDSIARSKVQAEAKAAVGAKGGTNFGGTQTDDFWAPAGDEVKELRSENKRLKVAMEEMQLKLKQLLQKCRDRGMNVEDLVAEVGLAPVLNAMSVWERLYNDAMSRITRVKKQEEGRQLLEELMPGVNLIRELGESPILEQLQPSPLRPPSPVAVEVDEIDIPAPDVPVQAISFFEAGFPSPAPVSFSTTFFKVKPLTTSPNACCSALFASASCPVLLEAEGNTPDSDRAVEQSRRLGPRSPRLGDGAKGFLIAARSTVLGVGDAEGGERSKRQHTHRRAQRATARAALVGVEGSFGFQAQENEKRRARQHDHEPKGWLTESVSLPNMFASRTDAQATSQMMQHIAGGIRHRHAGNRDAVWRK